MKLSVPFLYSLLANLLFSFQVECSAYSHPCYEFQGEDRTVAQLQQFQNDYDENFWFNRDFEKFRHVFLHLTDSIGKLAKYCETKEHGKDPDLSQLMNEVVPDLLMHTLQIANAFRIDLEKAYQKRIDHNIATQLNLQKETDPR